MFLKQKNDNKVLYSMLTKKKKEILQFKTFFFINHSLYAIVTVENE